MPYNIFQSREIERIFVLVWAFVNFFLATNYKNFEDETEAYTMLKYFFVPISISILIFRLLPRLCLGLRLLLSLVCLRMRVCIIVYLWHPRICLQIVSA